MNILISGHTGFVGRALSERLKGNPGINILGASLSSGIDLMHYASLAAVPVVDKILHLSAIVGVEKGWKMPRATFQNNLMQTLNLLEFARQNQTPFIYLSSYVYGVPEYLPIDEDHPISCPNPYAASKRQAEMLCEAYADHFNLSVTIIRLFNIYGPGQSMDNIIAHIMHQARTNDRIEIRDPKPKRDYLYIEDLTEALVKVLLSQEERTSAHYYNLGSGKSYSVSEIIDVVGKVLGRPIPAKVTGVQRPNEIPDCFCDFSRFAHRFGWRPKTDIETGIRRIVSSENLI